MAAAIPAAIGLGSSAIGAIGGKSAAKKQEKQAAEQLALYKPLIQAQTQGAQFALGQSKPFIRGAGEAMKDLQNKFYRPLAFGDRKAIDQFLSPERRAINQGYQSTQANVTRFGPRGGGRVSAGVNADMQRQGQLSDLVFNARREGAKGLQQSSQQLGALGTGLLASGLSGGSQANSLLQNQQQLAQRASERSDDNLGSLGTSLGGLLGQIFNGNKSNSAGSNSRFATQPILGVTDGPGGFFGQED